MYIMSVTLVCLSSGVKIIVRQIYPVISAFESDVWKRLRVSVVLYIYFSQFVNKFVSMKLSWVVFGNCLTHPRYIWYKQILDNKMGDEVTPPPFFFIVDDPAFTYLCIIAHHCNASESYFKEKSCIRDILINQKSSNLVNSLFLAYLTCVEVWDNMASLQRWFH